MAVGGSIDMISEFQVNTHTDGAQQYPAVTGLLEGDWVVVWLSLFQDGLTFSVRGLRYSGATGAKAGVEFMLNENTNVFRDEPDLAPLPDGGFVTVWSDGPTSNDANIVYRQYGNTGSPLGGPQVINTFTDNYQRYPAVASKSDGNFVVVWSSYLQDGDALGVFGQRMRMSLGAIGPEFPVNTTTTDIQWNSEVAYLPDGGFVVVWESKNQDEPGGYGVYARVWDLNGIAVTDEIPVNTFTGSDQRYPSLAVSTDGRFLVVWESWNQSGFGSDLYGQWFNTDFEPTGDELHLNSFLLDNQRRPVITSLDGGDLVLLYAGSGKHAHTGTHLRRLDAAGQPLAFDSRVNRNQFDNGTVWYQDIAPLADGGFVTVWQAGGDQDGESFGVFAARYNANGIRIYAGP